MARVSAIDEMISELASRVYKMEQRTTNPAHFSSSGTDQFNEIFIGPEGARVPVGLLIGVAGAPTATTGALFDNIFADISWGAIERAVEFEVLLEEQTNTAPEAWAIGQATRTAGNSVRYEALRPATVYRARVAGVNRPVVN